MCQMSQWPSPVCRCLLSDCLHLKQGWHNCHIPVSIRCPPQLKGLRKLGLGWGRKRGDRDKGKCRNSPDILLAYPLVTVLLCLRTSWHTLLWPCSHTCVHLGTPGGHSSKTKATLRGILQQISALVEKNWNILIFRFPSPNVVSAVAKWNSPSVAEKLNLVIRKYSSLKWDSSE